MNLRNDSKKKKGGRRKMRIMARVMRKGGRRKHIADASRVEVRESEIGM